LIKLQGKMLSTGDNKTIAPRSRFWPDGLTEA
jgi:hypothetical protein